jgi:hypothetical protein
MPGRSEEARLIARKGIARSGREHEQKNGGSSEMGVEKKREKERKREREKEKNTRKKTTKYRGPRTE